MSLVDLSRDALSLLLRDAFLGVTSDALFRYWTVPALLHGWWPQVAEVEPFVDGTYTFSWPGAGWRLAGRYTSFEAGRHLGFSWQWEHEPDASITAVNITFEAMGGEGTALTLAHGPYTDMPGSQEMRAGHLEGWTHFLGRLHRAVEQETAQEQEPAQEGEGAAL